LLIALDASTTATGFSFGGPKNGSPRGGVWRLPGAAVEVFDLTLCRAGESLKQLCQMIGATDVAIEAPLFLGEGSNSHTIAALMQLTGALRCVAKMAGCDVRLYGSSTVRKTFTGRGNMKKA
jgi:Holliday junction resolvasome RuvABC endonuclease subunit